MGYGPPATKFMGGRWMVENYEEDAGVVTVEKADLKSNVFITMCDECTIQITNKVKAVTIDSCVKVRVFVTDVVSTVEIVNCKSVKVYVVKGGKVPCLQWISVSRRTLFCLNLRMRRIQIF